MTLIISRFRSVKTLANSNDIGIKLLKSLILMLSLQHRTILTKKKRNKTEDAIRL